MALKKKLSKEDHAKLPDHLKTEYVEDGEGYRLDLDGEEDTGALKRAKDRESQLRRDAEKKLGELESKLSELEGDDARKKGDIATLEKAWQKKLDDANAAAQVKIDKLTQHTTKNLVDNAALNISNKISTSPALLLPHIRARLLANLDADEPTTVVLDQHGKPSNMTLQQLSDEFVANKDFSAIITASKASGGAGKPSQLGGGASKTFGNQNAMVDLSKANPADLAAMLKEGSTNT